MLTKQLQDRSLFFIGTLLLILSLITGCDSSATTSVPTETAPPKPTPIVRLNVSPDPPVVVGQGVAVVLAIEPYEQLDWSWEVSGTSGGQLNSRTGEQVVYTAGSKEGIDIIVVKATTGSGATVKQTVSLSVVAAPPTAVSAQPPASADVAQPDPLPAPSPAPPTDSGPTLMTPQDGQTVACTNVAKGTYPLDLKDYIWPIVYVGGLYYPQDEGGKAAQKNGGNWYQTVRFGDCDNLEKDKGKLFQLFIVTANESANAEFENFLKAARASGKWGMDKLPQEVEEQPHITVTRQ